jgi:four helix bundle protein
MYSYQRLEAWKQAHAAALLALESTDDSYHPRSKALFDQLKRAAISVEANIVEGYALGTAPLCRRHLRIAIGSAAEAECLARLAGERGYLDGTVVKRLEKRFGDAMRTLRGLMRHPPEDVAGIEDVPRTTHHAVVKR